MGNGRISAKQAEILEYIKAQILEKDIHRQYGKFVQLFI